MLLFLSNDQVCLFPLTANSNLLRYGNENLVADRLRAKGPGDVLFIDATGLKISFQLVSRLLYRHMRAQHAEIDLIGEKALETSSRVKVKSKRLLF